MAFVPNIMPSGIGFSYQGPTIDETSTDLATLQSTGFTAAVGSVLLNRLASPADANRRFYVKYGVNNTDWDYVVAGTELDSRLSALTSGLNWREAVKLLDTTSTTLPTGTPTQPVTIGSVSIANNERVLFAGLTAPTGKNVYIYDQANGVFIEDTNEESLGDIVLANVDSTGATLNRIYLYNGTDWVFTQQFLYDELTEIRSFIGKTVTGAETPFTGHTKQEILAGSNNLEAAIQDLDTAIGNRNEVANDFDLQSPLIASTDTYAAAIYKVAAKVNEISGVAISNVTANTLTTIDTITGDIEFADIRVVVREAATPANIYSVHYSILTDGTTPLVVPTNENYAGAAISGLAVSVSQSGADLIVQVQASVDTIAAVKRLSAFSIS